MQTLNEIISDLSKIAQEKNYEGATIDALIYLSACAIYKNQLNTVNTVLESSASKCTELNSAIQHAEDKAYSVMRGKNQHFLVKGARPLISNKVKKFDECCKIGKYKLLYAQDYDNLTSNEQCDIELILCTKLIEENLTNNLKKYIRSQSNNLTDDLSFYVSDINGNTTDTPYSTQIITTLGGVDEAGNTINANTFINADEKTKYLIITDTDFNIVIWIWEQDNPIVVFDGNSKYSIKSPEYTTESIDVTTITSLKNFDISDATITSVPRTNRETDVDSIFLASCVSDKSGDIIRSVNDIEDIFLNYFGRSNIHSCNIQITSDIINIVYLLDDRSQVLTDTELAKFKKYVKKAYYITQPINIIHANGINRNNKSITYYSTIAPSNSKYTVSFDLNGASGFKISSKNVIYGEYCKLPELKDGMFTPPTNKTFIGWNTNPNALFGYKDYFQVTEATSLYAIWIPNSELDNVRTVKFIYDSPYANDTTKIEEDGYTKTVGLMYTIKIKDSELINPIPDTPILLNRRRIFKGWGTDSTCTSYFEFENKPITQNYDVWADLESITINVYFDTMGGYPSIPQQVIYPGEDGTNPERPAYITEPVPPTKIEDEKELLFTGWYVNDPSVEDNPIRYDFGTLLESENEYNPSDFTLYAGYEPKYDFEVKIYFKEPIDSSLVTTFVDNYKYDIGKNFEPMRVISELVSNFPQISWIRLESDTETKELSYDEFYDFTFNINYVDESDIEADSVESDDPTPISTCSFITDAINCVVYPTSTNENKITVPYGDNVIFTVIPQTGYGISTVTYKDEKGNDHSATVVNNMVKIPILSNGETLTFECESIS